ncbi:hypothetical protein NWF32_11035 [Pseudomonas qingdaonensis]|nr:hypothetical protein [Pseudomonas qingdaonensis]
MRAANEQRIDTPQLQWLREALIPDLGALRVCSLALVPAAQDMGRTVLLADSLALQQPTDTSKGCSCSAHEPGFNTSPIRPPLNGIARPCSHNLLAPPRSAAMTGSSCKPARRLWSGWSRSANRCSSHLLMR